VARRRKLVLAGAAVVLLGVGWWWWSDDSTPGAGDGGAAVAPVLPQSPKDSVRAVYSYIAANRPDQACVLFTPQAAQAFAAAHGGSDCAQAARRLAEQVQDRTAYANPVFPEGSAVVIGTDAEVRSCSMQVTGGPRLGMFLLQRQPNGGWVISGHEAEPADCLTG